jgi:hypothetical protein
MRGSAVGLEAALVLGLFRLASRRMPLAVLWEVARGVKRSGRGDPAADIGRRVERVGRRFQADGGCYPEALAGVALLGWHGHRPEMVIGVRGGGSAPFEAHAWVEVDGEVVIGAAEAGRFRPIWRGAP